MGRIQTSRDSLGSWGHPELPWRLLGLAEPQRPPWGWRACRQLGPGMFLGHELSLAEGGY